jgi:hypothetical protein
MFVRRIWAYSTGPLLSPGSYQTEDHTLDDLGGLPQFITVRGGGYSFLPGIRALRFIARLKAQG